MIKFHRFSHYNTCCLIHWLDHTLNGTLSNLTTVHMQPGDLLSLSTLKLFQPYYYHLVEFSAQ